ncbi:MAG: hypothetical protein U0869_25145 [Chloroflexota bacterium]
MAVGPSRSEPRRIVTYSVPSLASNADVDDADCWFTGAARVSNTILRQ